MSNMETSKIIVALDFADQVELTQFIAKLTPGQCRLKVGKELITSYGPQIVRTLIDQGFEIFLDLKYHDIPQTVYKAITAACKLGVWMVNVHASGGSAMLKAAKQAINESSHKPLLIAVTMLTSLATSAYSELGYSRNLIDQVQHLATLAYNCGVDGVVCSAQEAAQIKTLTSHDFLCVTPGIRLASLANDDQSRIMTPYQAVENQADYLVIGRPITTAADPAQLLTELNQQIALITNR
jgi:orotidine-5'-phosphate decarboxylase